MEQRAPPVGRGERGAQAHCRDPDGLTPVPLPSGVTGCAHKTKTLFCRLSAAFLLSRARDALISAVLIKEIEQEHLPSQVSSLLLSSVLLSSLELSHTKVYAP